MFVRPRNYIIATAICIAAGLLALLIGGYFVKTALGSLENHELKLMIASHPAITERYGIISKIETLPRGVKWVQVGPDKSGQFAFELYSEKGVTSIVAEWEKKEGGVMTILLLYSIETGDRHLLYRKGKAGR